MLYYQIICHICHWKVTEDLEGSMTINDNQWVSGRWMVHWSMDVHGPMAILPWPGIWTRCRPETRPPGRWHSWDVWCGLRHFEAERYPSWARTQLFPCQLRHIVPVTGFLTSSSVPLSHWRHRKTWEDKSSKMFKDLQRFALRVMLQVAWGQPCSDTLPCSKRAAFRPGAQRITAQNFKSLRSFALSHYIFRLNLAMTHGYKVICRQIQLPQTRFSIILSCCFLFSTANISNH